MEKRKTSKDTTAYLFKRYIWLLDLIYNSKKISFEDINRRWQNSSLNYSCEELPLRTFHNHRLAISEMFDIDIACDRKDGNKYFIEYEEDLNKEKIRTWLLNSLSVNNIINESHRLKDRILFENIPSGQMFLTPIIEAMRENHAINITYQKFEHNKAYTFEIYPYCVKIFKQRWYVVAFNPYKNDILIYSLDRIKAVETTSNNFEMPKDFDGQEYFNDSFGIIVDNNLKTEEVLLKVYDENVKYIETLPLHHSQMEVEKDIDYTIFSYKIKSTYDFIKEILSHGRFIEVLAPDSLRKEIKDILKQEYERYI
ncbi:MAG: hypothetical protein H6Q16_211 [Bacteroidetes bacterium]|nr:hypothetical protein [Bacteroidota bacterium]